ncbi:bifunctional DNA primase/polymerase [Streptomyces xiaopingdaonensis]|uniref:bifunctional DNA primase/polymerase n=1 Tax=Streptomyces xiaopingdaonensis TaxID=1565415 RepID=UPI0002F26751|nr:bifunctional DNA primase/polymerase [Streptomyces xiaopingdaonensis]
MTKLDETTEAAAAPVEHALRYVTEQHWDVSPGTWLEPTGGALRCSCGSTACATPGAHPARPRWAEEATGSAHTVRALWSEQPGASVLLPTGRTFDVLDVPESAGFLALARMERLGATLGPVAATPSGRLFFFALPGTARKAPPLLRRTGRTADALDLTAHAEDDWVPAPPTRVGHRGAVQWVRRPSTDNRWLPDADDLVAPLAYACGRGAPYRVGA